MANFLYVEDMLAYQRGVRRLLEQHNHTVLVVAKISHAIEELSGARFDLIICDGSVEHEHDGLNWARQLHREGRRVVVLTNDPRIVMLKNDVPALGKWLLNEPERFVAELQRLIATDPTAPPT